MGKYYLAVDIGASSGRHILAHLENGKIRLEEIWRFDNGMKLKNGHLCWDLDHLKKKSDPWHAKVRPAGQDS